MYTSQPSIANLLSNHKVRLLEKTKVHIIRHNRGGISTKERDRERKKITEKKTDIKEETGRTFDHLNSGYWRQFNMSKDNCQYNELTD